MKSSLLFVLLFAAPAVAGENPFGYLYTAETTPAGRWEMTQWSTLRAGKDHGRYAAVDLRSEFETGLTRKLQAALYVNSSYLYNKGSDLPNHSDFNVNGLSAEFLYAVLNPDTDGLGLALSLEPEVEIRDKHTDENSTERALETKVILQKELFEDRLILGANLTVEPEWEMDEGRSVKNLSTEIALGASCRLRPKLYAGLEARHIADFPEMNTGHAGSGALYLGPTVHFEGSRFWSTLSIQPQVHGWPGGIGAGGQEKIEARWKVGFTFGGSPQ
jgi:hypothetical protein